MRFDQPYKATQDLAREMEGQRQRLRTQANDARAVVPSPTTLPPEYVPDRPRLEAVPSPPQRYTAPAGVGEALALMAASLAQLTALTQTLVAQNELHFRLIWMNFIANAALAPTRVQQPVGGTGGNNYTSATFAAFFQNLAKYPVGIIVAAQWNTPGGRLLISRSQSAQGVIGDLSNGATGGTLTTTIPVNPGETIYAANYDAGVALTASDLFLVRVIDYAGFIKKDVFTGRPWSL